MKKAVSVLFVLGAILISSCSSDSIGEQTSGNGSGTTLPTISKITSVFTNGTNMSIGKSQSAVTRGGGTLYVGEEESLCAKYDVAAGFQSNGTVPYIKVSVHVYEDCASECEKLRLTFKEAELECKADDFAIRSTDGTYLEGCYGTDEEGNKINEYKYGNLSLSGDFDLIIGGLDNLYKGDKKGGNEEPVINTFEVWIWPQNTKDHTWTEVELEALADNHDPLICVKKTPEDTHPGKDMGDIIWAEENIKGYYAWGEIFTGKTVDSPKDSETASYTYGGVTYTNDASYYPHYNKAGKNYYNYNDYRYFDGTTKMTKYQWETEGKVAKDYARLQPTDDVATMRWGDGWRMPTGAEMDDLLNGPNTQCVVGKAMVDQYDHETGKYYEVEMDALMVTSTITNNTIILPKTGFYGKNENYDSEESTTIKDFGKVDLPYFGLYYWTSDLSTQGGGYIFGDGRQIGRSNESLGTMAFDYAQLNGYDRCFGMKVRPVKDK